MAEQILFYIFSTIAIIGALMVVTSRNPVRAVLSMVLCFLAMAVVWMLMQVEFLALILVVVYVGAVMVLFLFVVMMLDIDVATIRASYVKYWPLALLVGVLLGCLLIWCVGLEHFNEAEVLGDLPLDYSSISMLGQAIFTQYLYPFILAAVLLLAAMIAAITLTFRGHQRGSRSQNIAKQVAVKASDRLRVVKMPVESKDKPQDENQ